MLEGLIRPADWTYNPDLKQSQLPTFGAYALGMEIARADNKVPKRAAIDLLDRASKKGKSQLPVLITQTIRLGNFLPNSYLIPYLLPNQVIPESVWAKGFF